MSQPHEAINGEHYQSLCKRCIGVSMELEQLREVVATTPDPDVARIALIAQGSIILEDILGVTDE